MAKLGPPRTLDHELCFRLYEFNDRCIRKAQRALEAMGVINPHTLAPYSYFGVRGAILYAKQLRRKDVV